MKKLSHKILLCSFLIGYFQLGWAQTAVVPLPATGQTTSYYAGDDGDQQKGVPIPVNRFKDNGNGTVTDAFTGLMWVSDANLLANRNPSFDQDRTPGDGDVDWKIALDYIKLLNNDNYLGYSDWRLPNALELRSLINLELGDTALPANHPFKNLRDLYWSATTSEESRSMAIGVFLKEHYAHSNIINPAGEMEAFFKVPEVYLTNYWKYYVLPVRGTTHSGMVKLPVTGQRYSFYPGDDGDVNTGVSWPTPRLVDNKDETITDRLTGLMWTRDANLMLTRDPGFDTTQFTDGSVPWITALEYINKLNAENYLGYNDWRMPNRNEMASLVDFSQHHQALPERSPFKNLTGYNFEGYYWTSTTRADETDQAWIIVFRNGLMSGGNALGYAKTRDWLVWPVRTDTQSPGTASIKGTITLNGNPFQRAEVKLTGPVNSFIRSTLNGEYELTNLPNGQYTVTPAHKYARFNPLSQQVNLNHNQVTADFSATYTRAYGWEEVSENLFPVGGAAGGCLSDLWFIGNEGWVTNSCFFKEIYHTTDGGDTWEIQSTLGETHAIYMLSADTGFAGGESGILIKTTDGGQNWNFFAIAPSIIRSIGFSPDGSIGFCGGADGWVSEIQTSSLSSQKVQFTDWDALSMGSNNYGWAVSCFGRKMIYENASWSYIGGAAYFPCYGDIQFNGPNTAWMTYGGEIKRFNDWQLKTFYNDDSASFTGVFTLDTNSVWAVSAEGDIAYTNRANSDTVHFTIDNIGDVFLTDVFAIDEHHAWAVGNNGSIFRYGILKGFPAGEAEILDVLVDHQLAPASINKTNRTVDIFLPDTSDLTQVIPEIFISAGATIDPPSGMVQDFSKPVSYTVTSENGQVANAWVVSVNTQTGISDSKNKGQFDFQLVPNPTTHRFRIKTSINEFSQVNIYNSLGQLIMERSLHPQNAEISIPSWTAGVYFVEVQHNEYRVIKKLFINH